MDTSGQWRARPLTWLDGAIGLGLGVAFVVVLMGTVNMGFVRDEGYYFHAAYDYLGWFKSMAVLCDQGDWTTSFTQAEIDRHFAYNQEHPVLTKVLFALSHWVFHEGLGWMSPSSSMRFPATLFSGLLVTLVYLFGAEAFGRWHGLFAALATIAMPRPFFHAHLAAFDYPINTMWFFVTYAWWKSLQSDRWGWAAGLIFGVALSVKHNVFFLPPIFVLHWLLIRGGEARLVVVDGRRRVQLPPIPVAFLSMATLGPLVWYVLWPSHWFDTYNRVLWYFNFHLKHVHYFQYYFGQNLYQPPFPIEYPFVMSLVTMPPATLAAFAIGTVAMIALWLRAEGGSPPLERLRRRFRARFGAQERDPRATGWLLALSVFVPFAVIAHPNTPIFGGIKHWMPAMPFMALVAAVGALAAAEALAGLLPEGARVARVAATASFLGLVIAPAITATAHNHPHGTAYYNELIGGARGAADRKMMRKFWGYSGRNGLPFLNREVPPSGQVFFQNTNHDSVAMYKRDGLLRADIRHGAMPVAHFGLIHHQMASRSLELEIWQAYETRNPAMVATYEGVPLLSIYPNTRRLPPIAPELIPGKEPPP